MKVGLLTFHSQLNYGGILQAWAGQYILHTLGHDVRMVDRWCDRRNATLRGPFVRMSVKSWCSFLLHMAFGCGQGAQAIRHWRTMRFVRETMRLTPYHFYSWHDLKGKDLSLDRLVVGSDQVWHCGDWGDPSVYLLEGAPQDLRAIAYAASFGLRVIPSDWVERFRVGLRRFDAISVREAEGIALAASVGVVATHVLDPTQLVPANIWKKLAFGDTPPQRPKHKRLVCYLLSVDSKRIWSLLERFALLHNCKVQIFRDGPYAVSGKPCALLGQFAFRLRTCLSPVQADIAAGPHEFLQAFAQADWILSDSFHALMFATLFNKNVRILRPDTLSRRGMFARIEEFAARYTSGPLISPDIPTALDSFPITSIAYNHLALDTARANSLAWLREHLC